MKKFNYLLLSLFFIILPKKVYADTYSLSLSCPDVVRPSQTISCSVDVSSIDFTITKLNATYSYSDGIISSLNNLSLNDVQISSTGNISSVNLTIPNDAQSNQIYNISLNNIIANDLINTANVNKSFRVVSSDTSLKGVYASGKTLTYDESTSTFSAIINEIKTTISASTNDPLATVTEGTGEKNLNYGKNSYDLTVLSESGTSKTYKVDITRVDNRETDNYLSSLFVTNTDISFNKTKTEYNLTTTASEVIISATKESTKASISGDLGKKSLAFGLNKFSINVMAENTSVRTYNINITRQDTRSSNNYLKSITLSSGEIKFNKNTTTYNIDVKSDVEKIKINATLDDSKAKFITGPREVNLNPGNNTVYLKVENEKGEVRTYTLNINRDNGKDSDSSLKEITLSDGNIEFDKDKFEYNINVEYDVYKIKIYPKTTSSKASVKINGDENLKVGKNKFTIIVEAENGAKSEYTIIINRKKQGYILSTNNYIKNLKISNYDIDFKKNKFDYDITIKEDHLNLEITLEDNKATYEILGNENLKNNSEVIIKVKSESGDVRQYTITVKKQINMVIILLMIVSTILTGALIYLVVLRIKRRNKLNSMYKGKVEVIDEDFIAV